MKNFFIALCIILAHPLFADNVLQKRFEYLVQQKHELIFAVNAEAKAQTGKINATDVPGLLQENEAKLLLTGGKIVSLSTQLESEKTIQATLASRIKSLQQLPLHTAAYQRVELELDGLKAEAAMGKKNQTLLEENLALAQQYKALLLAKQSRLRLLRAKNQYIQSMDQILAEQSKLHKVLGHLYTVGIGLQQKLNAEGSFDNQYAIEKKILLNSQAMDLLQSKLVTLNLNKKWVEADYLLQKQPSMDTLEKVTSIYEEGITALSQQASSLKQQLNKLVDEQKRFRDPTSSQQISFLIKTVKEDIQSIDIQEQTLQEDLETHQEALSKQLSKRTRLPDLRPASWPHILNQLAHIPLQFYQYLKNLLMKIYENSLWQDTWSRVTMWSGLVILIAGFMLGRWSLKRKGLSLVPNRLTARVYRGALLLIYRNMPYVAMMLAMLLLCYTTAVPFSNEALFLNLIAVFVGFRSLDIVARIVFIEKPGEASEHDWHLYHQIRGLLFVGGLITALMVFSHQYPLSVYMQELFNRLFMLFLLLVSFIIWRSQEVITHWAAPVLKSKKAYFRSVVFLLLILVPLTLLTTAVIGLWGYNNLAWSLSRYQAHFLLLIALYVLMRGLLIDAMEIISEWMVSSLYNGWLWIEVFLKPLDRVLRATLFLGMLFLLCKMLEIYSGFSIFASLMRFADTILVNMPGIYITVKSVIWFLLWLMVLVWIAKWTREFCFRWVYKNTHDLGIRNSFSVFTQYTVIVVGFFIAFRVLGFDFTGLSLVLGGLAVGMGFGLRDFASNIVGGLMLLIERPVREGDLVTIGDYEGRVAHIGIRSMRISSWDNMEVLIPNAETFNKPFTNWTHQDSIVRTVIPIKVCRQDSPEQVQALVLKILMQMPEILVEPVPHVYLTQIDEALIAFEARYFINVNLHTRFEVRSKVLFAITTAFKAAGIQSPLPAMQVELTGKDTPTEHED